MSKERDEPIESFYRHPQAIVESHNIGPGTRIWAFAHVLPGAIVGRECNICNGVFIENDVRIGDRVTIKCGVQVWDGVTLEDNVFVGPNATFTNDPSPRSKTYPSRFAKTLVRTGASIGANATILPGLTIGPRAMVGAGAVVTRDVPANAIVVGNPAYIKGYVNSCRPAAPKAVLEPPGRRARGVSGVRLVHLKLFTDLRGSLAVAELAESLPFVPKRIFVVFDVPSREVRGEHAHRRLHQFLVCLKGECSLVVDDGTHRQELLLDSPRLGVHVPPLVWGVQYKFSPDAVLAVLASDSYDPTEYVRDYDEFLELLRHRDQVRKRGGLTPGPKAVL